jgi:hypothetical protein
MFVIQTQLKLQEINNEPKGEMQVQVGIFCGGSVNVRIPMLHQLMSPFTAVTEQYVITVSTTLPHICIE